MALMDVMCTLNFCVYLREEVMTSWDLVASVLLLLWCVTRAWSWWRHRVPGTVWHVQDARRILWTLGPTVAVLSFWWSKW